MDDGSPSRRKEKRSKHNQDRAATPKLTGHTKAAYPCDGAGSSRAQAKRAHGHGAQGSAAIPPPPPVRAFAGDDPIVDAEEEAFERAGRTIVAEVMSTPSRGPGFFSELVIFDGPLPVIREPQLAPNPADGFTPPLLVDYHHKVWDIRSMRDKNLYAEEEKDLRLEYRFWHPFHFDYYESILYNKFLKKREPPVLQRRLLMLIPLVCLRSLN